MEAVKDASHLYEVERRDRHAERPGFRISELQLSPTQQVPWHSNLSTRSQRRSPARTGRDLCCAPGARSLGHQCRADVGTFLILQGIGEYDYVPLTHRT